ncbi:oligosaccharide flippase family protein [Desemzia sp. RIT804]|uniref:lipopolysaccharide biosynthesis protein n=1 Tax=Desemzia sp. RIT 804 TaxID=2810209 RepID=UPI00194F73E5|nr:oligosaccharide flippase family protein [Desemzia sp. RIT 804]MBM6615954.1 oligosaccharide flippase family protein [Desemzia sp. RIT 804]
MKLMKDIFRVASSNIINFGSSFLVGFVLPLYLSVSEYGYYKEFTLYLSFVYLFNLGYNDGITIKYGGKDSDNINKRMFRNEHSFIMLFQLAVLMIMLIVSLYLHNIQFIMVSIVSFFICMTTFHQNFLQATGDFKFYANTNIIKTVVNVVTIILGILFFDSHTYITFVVMNILTNIVVFLSVEHRYYQKYGFGFELNKGGNLENFRVGIFVLIANMSLTFVGNVGSWIVNLGFSIEDFAVYSFSNSLLNIILLIVNSVGLIFFNIIAKNENPTKLKFTKRLLLLLGVMGGEIFFSFKLIIEVVLPQYGNSLSILSITFISIPYIMVSKILIANLYKARKNEKKYFRDMVLLAISSVFIVGVTYLLTRNMLMIAVATLVIYALWYFYSTGKEFDYLKSSKKEYFLLGSHLVVFYIMGNEFSIIYGAIGYLIYIIIVAFFFRKDFSSVLDFMKK